MRKKYIDNIRWITVVLVVVYHVFYLFNGVGVAGGVGALSDAPYQDAVLYLLYPWLMLLLFVVSGMSARFYLEHHTHSEFVKSKTTKLLVPSTIGLFVFWWMLGYFNLKIGGAFESMGMVPKPIFYLILCFSGIGPLWYIQLLWLFSVLLIVFRTIEKDKLWNFAGRTNVPVLLLLSLWIWAAAQIGNMPVIVVYRFGIYSTGYFLGYFVFSHDEVMNRVERGWLPLSISALVLGILFTITFWGKPYAQQEVFETFLYNLYAWIAVLGILAFMKKWGQFENRFTCFMIQKSWGLYLFHYLLLAVSAFYLYHCAMPTVCKYLLTAFSGFLGSLLLYEIMRRIPVLRWCVCGIGHPKTTAKQAEKGKKAE